MLFSDSHSMTLLQCIAPKWAAWQIGRRKFKAETGNKAFGNLGLRVAIAEANHGLNECQARPKKAFMARMASSAQFCSRTVL